MPGGERGLLGIHDAQNDLRERESKEQGEPMVLRVKFYTKREERAPKPKLGVGMWTAAARAVAGRCFSSQMTGKARTLCTFGKRIIDRASCEGELRVFIVAGEVSGDSMASRLMSSLKIISPIPVHYSGVGGVLMHQEGLQSLFPMEDISVMGIFELLPYLNKIRMRLKMTLKAAILFKPHVVVTVDSKGFSFRLLKRLQARLAKEEDRPVYIHYIAPSFWAWKGGERRLGNLSEFVDHMLCILPFEDEICRLNGIAASYVGHPVLEDALRLNKELDAQSIRWRLQEKKNTFRQQHGIPSGNTIITLLPGSRMQEVKRMLPIFSQTMESLANSFTGLSVVIPVAPNQQVASYIEKVIQTWSISTTLISGMSVEERYTAFSASRAALSTSGSAVMELLLAGLPSVVAYRAHFLTEWFIRFRTKLQFISLPNILLGSMVIPEALFNSCTHKNLKVALSKVILDEDSRRQQLAAAEKVFRLLSPQDLQSITEDNFPSMKAASIILDVAKQRLRV
ncbi:hypothetical protein HPP92_010001 [Vanilla planifolia]|uniref:lipid-A-disaccharide synthase n=1 Tax=Vanilla planifolia TaxID=51239 RepID=A0A835RH96_VANPL|nr:hypothetical protein HPP92_010001 [Vanilla planifolia]